MARRKHSKIRVPPGHHHHVADGLVRHLLMQGFTAEEILASGLAELRPDGRLVDRIVDSTVLPIRDQQEEIIGFVGMPDRCRTTEKVFLPTLFDTGVALYWPIGWAKPNEVIVVVQRAVDALAVASALASTGDKDDEWRIVPVSPLDLHVSGAQWSAIAATKPLLVLIGPDSNGLGQDGAHEWLAQARSHGLEACPVNWGNALHPAELMRQSRKEELLTVLSTSLNKQRS